MADRPTPPDPFARKTSPDASPPPLSLSEALAAFAPQPISDAFQQPVPIGNTAPDTGRGGRPRRRGDNETRIRAINFRMRPREQTALNNLCDELNKSIPDTIMILIEHYRHTV